jgi:glycosyltransferase involved in cell wall biosynthesis
MRNNIFDKGRKKLIGIDAHAIGLRKGGNETYAYGLLNGLSKIEHPDFKYVVFFSKGVEVPEFLSGNPQFSVYPISLKASFRFLADLPAKTYTKKLDLLHTQYHLPVISNCPGIISLHDVSFLRHPEFFPRHLYWVLRMSLPHSVRKAKKVITISEFSKREIIEFYHPPSEKVAVTYLASSENFRPAGNERKKEILKKYGIKSPYILSVSNLQPRKNLERLIKSFVSILKSDKGFPCDLVIVGQKLWLYNKIFNEIRRSKYSERIILTDYVPENDLPYLYSFAEVLVYPSIYEGFGLPVLEAMACGCPVITSNLSSLPEVAGEACLLVNPYRVEEIAGAIREVIEKPEMKQRLREAGLEQSNKFSWKKTAEKTLQVYEEVLSEKKQLNS